MTEQDRDTHIKSQLAAYIAKVSSPEADADISEHLEDLNAILISANYLQIRQVASQLDFTSLFHHFNAISEELFSSQISNAFSMLLEALSANEIFVKYYENILEGLQAQNFHVVELWLKKIVKPLFTNEALLKNVSGSSINILPFLKLIVQLLASETTAISSIAHDICVIAAKSYRMEFFSPAIQDELKKLKQLNKSELKLDKDTIKIRIYEVYIDIASTNQLLLDLVKSNGLLLEITKEFEEKISNDPLVALNMVKLITDLASQSHGLDFLRTSTAILPSIAAKIENIDLQDVYGSLLLPGLINFFVRIAEYDITVLTQFNGVMAQIMKLVEQDDISPEFMILGIDSISYICHKNSGKIFIADYATSVLKRIASIIKKGSTELKGRIITALNGMMELGDADPGNKANQLTETWYTQLASSDCGISKFMELAQEPFPELRIPALNFIRIIASSVWGQKILAETGGFIDYLLDRRTETTKEGREAKFEIVRELCMSPFIRLSFTPEVILRIRGYFKTGPIDSDEVNVAFENA